MTQEELEAMVAAEEKRLGVGSSEFMERHREIMELADQIQRQNKKCPWQSGNSDRGRDLQTSHGSRHISFYTENTYCCKQNINQKE